MIIMNLKQKISYWSMRLALFGLFVLACYGTGRLYFYVTDGFTVSNISSDFAYQTQWAIKPLTSNEKVEADQALNQDYHYLGKGCQSYAFLSEDGQFVIKFFKYQRFRLQPWLTYLPPLGPIVRYRDEKALKKWNKLNVFVMSWKIAFENLKAESGLVLVHLNKTTDLQRTLVIYDKIGQKHVLNLDDMEFCIQRRAEPLSNVLVAFKEKGQLQQAETLLSNLLNLILSEYLRGLTDNDHALLQNTGVVNNQPIHIDVGQFLKSEKFRSPLFYHQDLFTRTYRLKVWLKENYPPLGTFLETRLREIIGPSYDTMQPQFHAHWEVQG
jgi:hypothetical protein